MAPGYGGIRGIAVSETDRWLSDYGDSHADIRNPGVYWLSVPILVLGTVGMLWSLPVPEEFVKISPVLNWGSAFLMAAMVYYFIISISLAIGMLPFVAGVTALQLCRWSGFRALCLSPASSAFMSGTTRRAGQGRFVTIFSS